MLMPFRLSPPTSNNYMPLVLYNVGCHNQHPISRPLGYVVHQCFVVFSGTGQIAYSDGTKMELSAGTALLLPHGKPHAYIPLTEEPWMVGYIGFSGRMSAEIAAGCGLPFESLIRLRETDPLKCKLKDMWELSEDKKAGPSQLSVRLYEYLLLLSELAESSVFTGASSMEVLAEEAMHRAAGYMHEHYSEKLLMSNIASVVGYSVQHFHRLFRETYGITPHAYLQQIRLDRAVVWLKDSPGKPVKEIAGLLGMETNYFIRIFKQAYGCSPGVFREQMKDDGKDAAQRSSSPLLQSL